MLIFFVIIISNKTLILKINRFSFEFETNFKRALHGYGVLFQERNLMYSTYE